ncbi:DUF4255 domain-containing protein [Cryobacterium sandaracinum]|uniref:DUF4255 domain-containing protein n=2 Tax=Cryobacterium sandaracinum TaxID=1259247 RepID=A0ABY2J6J7_9MICO|nr:DUF4255 domain-containing protein [Cryobacterium sandaracinum]
MGVEDIDRERRALAELGDLHFDATAADERHERMRRPGIPHGRPGRLRDQSQCVGLGDVGLGHDRCRVVHGTPSLRRTSRGTPLSKQATASAGWAPGRFRRGAAELLDLVGEPEYRGTVCSLSHPEALRSRGPMSSLTNYGQAIASTTVALQRLLSSPPIGLQVTAYVLGAPRTGVIGPSINLFLYYDSLISYREETQRGPSRVISELHYLVSAFPGDDVDTDAGSHRAFGAARAAIERHPVLNVPIGSADNLQVWLSPSPLTNEVLTSLWLASNAPLRLSFGVMASFTLDAAERTAVVGTVRDVVKLAGAGALAVFTGADAVAKAEAAASVANELGKPLVTVPLNEVVGASAAATEDNLGRIFEQAEHRGAVLMIAESDPLFGMRPEVLDVDDPYSGLEIGSILDLFGQSPSVVIIELTHPAGDELADRTRVEVRFPGPGPEPEPDSASATGD